MVNKTRHIEPGKLTAYERWELPNIGTDKPAAKPKAEATQKIRPPTAEEIEAIRQQAYEEGKEEGYAAGFEEGKQAGLTAGTQQGIEEGFEQGLNDGQSKIEVRLQQLDRLLSELVVPIKKQQDLIEEAMLNVSMAVARAVIYRELSLDSSSVKVAIERILNELPKTDKDFVLSIHPQDENAVAPVLKRYDAGLTLKLDQSLAVGGCILESSHQFIDYTIEKRFQKTVQTMLSAAIQNVSDQSGHELPSSINALTDYPSEVLQEHSAPRPDNEDEATDAGKKAGEHD
jgi:flagellar assembly protein FliH